MVMNPRELVYRVFDGVEVPRVPMHVESDDKDEEFAFGDVVGIGAKIMAWRKFYVEGGPFRRLDGEKIADWINRIDIDSYEWPSIGDVVADAVKLFKKTAVKYGGKRFVLFKVLGPTETAESFFAPPTKRAGQIYHVFGFAMLLKLRPRVAYELYDRISRYLLELVKAGAELDFVDGVRVADDVADYRGLLYPRKFVEEKYLVWHRELASAIRNRGKYPIMHNDGNLVKAGVFKQLTSIYRGIHPLDFTPKATVSDALKWIKLIINARRLCGEGIVFFTGIPVDLVFNDMVSVNDIVGVVSEFIKEHGSRYLVLATTHSPYPGRSYREVLPRAKIEGVRKYILGQKYG